MNMHAKPAAEPPLDDILAGLTGDKWPDLKLPARRWAIEGFFCTSTRMMIAGQSGAGKTLLCLDLANAIANGTRFLDWPVVKPMRVLYLDAELDGETMRERITESNKLFAPSPNLLVLNHDVIPDTWMAWLNSDVGERWLFRIIDAWKPDIIVYDSLAFLTNIDLKKPEEFTRVNLMMKKIKARHIGQILVTHTGYDASRSYGDAQKDWPHDTVIVLSVPEGEDVENPSGRIVVRFTKHRHRKPATSHLFKSMTIQRHPEGWEVEGGAPKPVKAMPQVEMQARHFVEAYDLLTGDKAEPGHNRAPVYKVRTEAIRDLMIQRGWLMTAEDEAERKKVRVQFHAAKERAKDRLGLTEVAPMIWRVPPR